MPSTSLPYTIYLHDALPICALYEGGTEQSEGSSYPARSHRRVRRACEVGTKQVLMRKNGSTPRQASLHRATKETDIRVEWTLDRSEEHTSELQSLRHLVCRLPLYPTLFTYTTLFRSVHYTKEELSKVKDHLIRLAHIEGFDAHAKSAQSRFS